MNFADDKKEVVSRTGIGILGKAPWRDGPARLQSKDVQTRERGRADKIRCGEQERTVDVFEAQEDLRSAHGNNTQEDLLIGERVRVQQECSGGHGQDGRNESSRLEGLLHHALPRASVGGALSGPDWALQRASRHFRYSWSRQSTFFRTALMT